MLSKRGKANGKATANKRPRTARANQKSKPARTLRKPQRANGATRPHQSRSMVSAPLAAGEIMRNFAGFRFGVAPPHDEFPEGGLRISGIQTGGTASSHIDQAGTVGIVAVWNNASVLTDTLLVSPCGLTSTNCYGLFAASGSVANFVQYFRKYRFRKLSAEVESTVTPSGYLGGSGGATTNGSPLIQLSYEPDPWTGDSVTTWSIDSAANSFKTTRFNAWVPKVICPLITDSKHSRDDDLFYTTAAGDGIVSSGAGASAIMRQCAQGVIVGVNNTNMGVAGVVNNAKVVWHFELDLYGFTNFTAAVLPADLVIVTPVRTGKEALPHAAEKIAQLKRQESERFASMLQQSQDRGDSKLPFQRDRDELVEFIDLTPRSERLRIRPEMFVEQRDSRAPPPSVTSAKVGSKK